jgi:hypothetical protein
MSHVFAQGFQGSGVKDTVCDEPRLWMASEHGHFDGLNFTFSAFLNMLSSLMRETCRNGIACVRLCFAIHSPDFEPVMFVK